MRNFLEAGWSRVQNEVFPSRMPVHKGRDSKGIYYQWGNHGKKYRGKDAKEKAARQGRAAHAHGYRGK